MQRTHTVLSATAFAVIACAAANARAEDTITLKFAMAVPPSHYTAVQGGKFFMDRATELSKGRIKFEWYPAEQLGKAKDLLALVQTGVADMADVVPGYVPDKLPLSGVSELPGQITSSCEGTRVFYALTRPGQFLAKNEYDAQKVHVLMAAPLVPYRIFTSKKELEKPEDIQGLKLRSAGGASDIALTRARCGIHTACRAGHSRVPDARNHRWRDVSVYQPQVFRPYRIHQVRNRRRRGRLGSHRISDLGREVEGDSG